VTLTVLPFAPSLANAQTGNEARLPPMRTWALADRPPSGRSNESLKAFALPP
jgi:hypothetical protein